MPSTSLGAQGGVLSRCARCALQELLEVVDEVKGRYIITSDHGNADEMVQVSRVLGQLGRGGLCGSPGAAVDVVLTTASPPHWINTERKKAGNACLQLPHEA